MAQTVIAKTGQQHVLDIEKDWLEVQSHDHHDMVPDQHDAGGNLHETNSASN